MKKLNIILVDDNTAFRQGLKEILEIEYAASIVAEASTGEEFLKLKNIHIADLIFMDLFMPEKDGFTAAKQFLFIYPQMKIIAITLQSGSAFLRELIEIGFRGCILKTDLYKDLQNTIKSVLNDEYHFPDSMKIDNH